MRQMKKLCALALAAVLALGLLPLGLSVQAAPAQGEILRALPFTGDAGQCELTPEMAAGYAALLREKESQYSLVKAAFFDGGGVPMLWLAWGDSWDDDAGGLDRNYGDQVYTWADGQPQACKWITSVLQTGEGGAVSQMRISPVSDHVEEFELFRLSGGQIAAEPFASGQAGPWGSALTGHDFAPEEMLHLEALYRLADPDFEILLNAESGLADILMLSGNWGDGAQAAEVLETYGRSGGGASRPTASFSGAICGNTAWWMRLNTSRTRRPICPGSSPAWWISSTVT